MNEQLWLNQESLTLFLEPTFKRQTIGHYSIDNDLSYHKNEREKASLVALKEENKTSQGITEYEVPMHILDKDLSQGYSYYDDDSADPRQEDLLIWLKNHPNKCADVDVVCSNQAMAKIFKAPFTESTATPWELRLVSAPDGVCFLDEDPTWKGKYSEMNNTTKQQFFCSKTFQRFMTTKTNDHDNTTPPTNSRRKLLRVNKVHLDSGTVIYQSEVHCYDKNYNLIDFRVQKEGQFDLPSPVTRLGWWADNYISGTNTVMCGYYDDERQLTKIMSFDLKHVKPRRIRDSDFDEELCISAMCSVVQFVQEITADGTVASCILRFEPGSKRLCVLDVQIQEPPASHSATRNMFATQVSASDEISSVENTPRSEKTTPREGNHTERDKTDRNQNANIVTEQLKAAIGEVSIRQRYVSTKLKENGSLSSNIKRRGTLITESGGQHETYDSADDIDEDKYKPKKSHLRRRNRDDEDDINWLHVGIVFSFIIVGMLGVPWVIENGLY